MTSIPQLSETERAILQLLFNHYPKQVKISTLRDELAEASDFEAELMYLVEKRYVKEFRIPSESKWKGRLERIAWNVSDEGGREILSGRAYRIRVEGIDLLRSQLGMRDKKPLTKKQVTESVPFPATKKTCAHKHLVLVDIRPGSTTSVSGGLPVVKGEKSRFNYLSFHQCTDCGEVFYKRVEGLE